MIWREIKNKGEDVIDFYTTILRDKKLKFIAVDNSTREGKILLKAKTLLFQLLPLDYIEFKKARRFYSLLDFEKDFVNLTNNFLDQQETDKDKEVVIKDIQTLFPDNFLISPLFNAWGALLIDRSIVLNESLFKARPMEDDEEVFDNLRAVKIMFVLLHELAHKKKMINMANNFTVFEASENIRRICKKEGEDEKETTGESFEKHCFGGVVNFNQLSPQTATKIFMQPQNKTNWKDVIKELKFTEPKRKEQILKNRRFCQQRKMDEHLREMDAIILHFKKRFEKKK